MVVNILQPKIALTNNMELINGAHILYTYSDYEKYIENAVSFVSTGLTLGHGVIFIDNEETFDVVLNELRQKGFSQENLDKIVFANHIDFYGANDIFTIDRVIQTFSKLVQPFIDQEIPLRSWANVIWLENQCCLLDKLKTFEAEADLFVSQIKTFSVCAYDGSMLPSNIHLEMMKNHPYIMTDTEMALSSFYHKSVPPSIFIEENLEEKIIDMDEEIQTIHFHNQNLIEGMPEAVIVSSNDKLIFANQSALSLLEYENDILLGKTIWDIYHPDYFELIKERQEMLKNGEKLPLIEKKVLTKKGTVLDVEVVNFPFVFEGLEHPATISILRNISERKRLDSELRAAKANAEKSNHMKSVFLSQMSHDLRTPLNTIQGFTQIMLSSTDRDVKDQYKLQKIQKASEHLLELIEELLDFSAIEAGIIKLFPVEIHLKSFIQECVSSIPVMFKENVRISVQPVKDDIYIKADQIRLKQILNNLLTNAIKYNRPNGHVEIFIQSGDQTSEVRINIRDTGIGIPTDDLSAIFDPFYRSEKTMAKWNGTGLGLAIVAELTTIMDGKYGVCSEEGIGTVFWVSFKQVDMNHGLSSKHQNTLSYDEKSMIQKEVLYIEDNQDNIILMEAMLDVIIDVKLTVETTGEKGILRAAELQPDIILLDMGLPDLNGLDVLKRLKANANTKHIPVIIVSADAFESSIEKAMKEGSLDYITKPIDLKKLRTVITS